MVQVKGADEKQRRRSSEDRERRRAMHRGHRVWGEGHHTNRSHDTHATHKCKDARAMPPKEMVQRLSLPEVMHAGTNRPH